MSSALTDPRLDGFDWTLVRSFLAVLDAGSMSGGAKRLGAHQPTLSRQVATLEAQLGAPLFERTGRGATPTALALAIADDARAMQEGAERLRHRLTRARTTTLGDVRITTSQVAATRAAPPAATADQAERFLTDGLSPPRPPPPPALASRSDAGKACAAGSGPGAPRGRQPARCRAPVGLAGSSGSGSCR